MINKSKEKNKMPCLNPNERNKNFEEVALGYSQEDAIKEAQRCLNCKNKPCVSGCPVGVKIPEFIEKVAKGEFNEAYEIIKQDNALPAICGRVCPQENQCEGRCVRKNNGESVAIGRLERFVADYHNLYGQKSEEQIIKNGVKIAVVGSGPAGLTCAGYLAKAGYDVTVFEALHTAGGVLAYGIPEFRLPKSIVKAEINTLKELGVKIETNVVIGKTLTLKGLEEDGYEAVFIGTGAGLPRFMGIRGENANGVFSSNEFLTRINLMKAYLDGAKTPLYRPKKAVVVGGGNVAMDSARCAKRLGADVTIVYRRTLNELPARKEEVENAIEEGIEIKTLTNPIEVLVDETGWVKGVRCEVMELGEKDASGRAQAVSTGKEIIIEADSFIIAIGTTPNPLIKNSAKGLTTSPKGCIKVDEDGLTSLVGIYAGGDAVTGSATIILAMGAGKNSAKAIDEYIKNKGK